MKKLLIHGGSSLITKHLIDYYSRDFDEFHVFARNLNRAKENLNFVKKKVFFYENSIEQLDQTIKSIEKLPDDLNSIIWVSGDTGNASKEYLDLNLCKKTLKVNFTNIILALNYIMLNKILINKDSFLCVFTSVAGMRGRNHNTFYGAAKAGLISYLSSLRQKYNKKMLIVTIIPGYMRTNQHTTKTSSFITCSPKKSAKIVYQGILKKKEIIYIDYKWKLIMKLISLIPEKIFKKLKF